MLSLIVLTESLPCRNTSMNCALNFCHICNSLIWIQSWIICSWQSELPAVVSQIVCNNWGKSINYAEQITTETCKTIEQIDIFQKWFKRKFKFSDVLLHKSHSFNSELIFRSLTQQFDFENMTHCWNCLIDEIDSLARVVKRKDQNFAVKV